MTDEYPDAIDDLLSDDDRTDVSDEYQDVIETLVSVAHNQSLPVPIQHVVAYVDDALPSDVAFVFVVDTDDVLDDTYVLGLTADRSVLDDEELPQSLFDQYRQELRVVRENIWTDVVNTGWTNDE